MKNTTKERLASFLLKADDELCTPLGKERQRFSNVDQLLKRFRDIQDIEKQLKCGNKMLIHQVIETTNELCVAKWILDSERKCNKLIYEPLVKATAATKKTIDFCAFMENGQTIYIDVKTIHPEIVAKNDKERGIKEKENWKKFEKTKERGFFPKNVHIHLDEHGLGGEIWHDSSSSRVRMLEYTIELEGKINNYETKDKTFFVMVFCSDGFDWCLDNLEDFADFYTTGRYNSDDPFRKMEKFSIETKRIKFQKNITAFCYLERSKAETKVARLVCPVQGL